MNLLLGGTINFSVSILVLMIMTSILMFCISGYFLEV